jgi:ASC-1-like (ASCH) protein
MIKQRKKIEKKVKLERRRARTECDKFSFFDKKMRIKPLNFY